MANKAWFKFKNMGQQEVQLAIFDEIGGFGTCASAFVDQLGEVGAGQTIRVNLFSPGGYVDDGVQIYNALRKHPARVVIEIDAMAASIASIIAMAGDEIRMSENAFMMIHDPWSGVVGSANDMRQTADVLDQLKGALIATYAKRTGLGKDKIEAMMAAETWMVAADAVALGFADVVDGLEEDTTTDSEATNQTSFAANIVNSFQHIPQQFKDLLGGSGAAALMLSPAAMADIKDFAPSADGAKDKAGAMPEKSQKTEVVMSLETTTHASAGLGQESGAKNAVELERNRVKEIQDCADGMASTLKGAEINLARNAIASGQSVGEFQAGLLAKMKAKSAEQASPIGMTDNEVQSFSFLRLMNAMATNNWDNAGFERSVCEATAQKTGKQAKGAFVPTDVVARPSNAITTTGASPTIQTDVLAASFIDLLRNKMRVRALGATVLGGLEGNLQIPRQAGGASAFWVGEGAQPAQSQASFDSVALAPRGVAAETHVTTQTLIQSGLDMEGLIRNDIATAMALAIDDAAINGNGLLNTPTGILNTTGIGSVLAGGAALSNVDLLIDLESALANVNADEGNMAYLTNTNVIAQLKKLKTTTGEYLWTNEAAGDYPSATLGSINGYGVARSNQVPANLGAGTNQSAMLFGNWSDLLIGEWGVLDLQVDPYTAGVGNIRVTALQFVDVAVRHPESFAAITDIG